MFLEIAPYGKMAETGRSILRLIQNNRTATLDLLVRECLQNSLDAAAGEKVTGKKYVEVEFITNNFDSRLLAKHFSGIENKLSSLHPGRNKYIAIKDKYTTGLTGPIRASDNEEDVPFGNFLKLVYEISKPQENEGSGGSWGLGKTVYYRVGIGLVIYYTRIFDTKKKQYVSRLAAALVEDETAPNTLLKKEKLGRGIAWWGRQDPLDKNNSLPLTDLHEIQYILDVFGLEPYRDNETGTTIIIPYINENKLLKETIPHSEDGIHPPYWTQQSVAEYMVMAAQRWYAPRINNPKYQFGSYLRLFKNGKRIINDEIAPFFQLVQKLYNAAPDDDSEFNGKKIICKEVGVRNIIDTLKSRPVAGWISFIKVDIDDMKMIPPYNLESPYRYINKEPDVNYNNPIIMYTRKPGLIVSYELSGDWVSGIPTTSKDEFIVGLFFAASDAHLLKYNCTLEEYLRRGEKADHMSWGDWTHNDYPDYHPNITVRIQRGVRKKLQDNYAEINDQLKSRRNIGLGRMLADFLLPPEGFSGWDSGIGGGHGEGGIGGDGSGGESNGGGGGNGKGTSSGRLSMQTIGTPDFHEKNIDLKIRLSFGGKKSGIIEALVISEVGMMSVEKWEKQIGSPFPISLNSVLIHQITRRKGRKQAIVFDGMERLYSDSDISGVHFEFCYSEIYNTLAQINIRVPSKDGFVIEGIINYSISEKGVTGTFSFREGE